MKKWKPDYYNLYDGVWIGYEPPHLVLKIKPGDKFPRGYYIWIRRKWGIGTIGMNPIYAKKKKDAIKKYQKFIRSKKCEN